MFLRTPRKKHTDAEALRGGGVAPPRLRIRFADERDADDLARLARLDSTRPPRGLVLVAQVGRSLWAAVSIDDAHAVSDPRKPAGDLTWQLLEHVRRLKRASAAELQGVPRVWPVDLADEFERSF